MRLWIGLLVVSLCALASPHASLPVVFEKNTGQSSSKTRFIGRAPGAALLLDDDGAILSVQRNHGQALVRMSIDGGKRHPKLEALRPLAGRANYFIGNDPSKWRTGQPLYSQVCYRDVYPGIDLVFRGGGQTFEYDWIVNPGADPRAIRMSFKRAGSAKIDQAGDLVLRVDGFEIRHRRPSLVQDGRPIDGHFVARGRAFGFEIARYDPSRPLTIDPVLTYASYVGGAEIDTGVGVAFDPQGAIILTGFTSSLNLRAKKGVFLSPPNQSGYALIAKIDPTLSGPDSLVWLTFLGGSTYAQTTTVSVDSQGNVYVAGFTESNDFPLHVPFQAKFATTYNCQFTTVGGQPFNAPCNDGFITKLSPAGDALVYSSYIGGEADDDVLGMYVTPAGTAYICGVTGSTVFNTTTTAYQRKLGGTLGQASNAFVARVTATGSLSYSTLIGGSRIDEGSACTADAQGTIYLTGTTTSANFPTVNPLQSALAAQQDGFIAELNTSLAGPAQLVYSTFLGGSDGTTTLRAIAVDAQGNVIVTGGTNASKYPVTVQPDMQPAIRHAVDPNDPNKLRLNQEVVISKLKPSAASAAQLLYSSTFGGSGYDDANGMILDSTGKLLIVGSTDSPDFPVTPDGFQPSYGSAPYSVLGFIAKIDLSTQAAATPIYSTYFGPPNTTILAVASSAKNIAVTGTVFSPNLPVTAGAFQPKTGDSTTSQSPPGDGFIALFDTGTAGPSITAMTNAASFVGAGDGASPGEMVTLFGSNLGPSSLVGSVLDANGKLPTTVEGCQVLANGTPSPIVYVWTQQSSVILPYELTPQIGKDPIFVQVVCNGVAGNLFPLKIVDAAPGIFSAGNGQAAVLNADGSANSAANPAARGSIVQIFATGEGVLNPAGVDGRIETGPVADIPKPVLPVGVTFAGVASPNITYAAVAPDAVDGLLQVDAQVPMGIAAGNTEIILIVGAAQSPKGLNIVVK